MQKEKQVQLKHTLIIRWFCSCEAHTAVQKASELQHLPCLGQSSHVPRPLGRNVTRPGNEVRAKVAHYVVVLCVHQGA